MNELIQIGPISPLRQRLIDDMAFRRFTQVSIGPLIAGICQACILIRTGVMVLFEVMPHDDVRVGCLNVRNAVLEVRSRLNEVTATTVPVDHHRSGVRPAISGWV
jgi:hypothetical protein